MANLSLQILALVRLACPASRGDGQSNGRDGCCWAESACARMAANDNLSIMVVFSARMRT